MGGKNVPRVMADVSNGQIQEKSELKPIGHHYLPATDKWHLDDQGADFLYAGSNTIPFMVANGSRVVYDFAHWNSLDNKAGTHPLFQISELDMISQKGDAQLNFLKISDTDINENLGKKLRQIANLVLILSTQNPHAMPALRRAFVGLIEQKLDCPVVISLTCKEENESALQLFTATDAGGLLVDGLGDGIMVNWDKKKISASEKLKTSNQLCFGILQAARTRMSKTEYISCPSCGRTLFDLQETTAIIRKRTDHLKGVKIGIMGCIVNGPGEMADADYGYVGVGRDKIALYRGQNVVKKAVPASEAVDELIGLIREDGIWIEAANPLSDN